MREKDYNYKIYTPYEFAIKMVKNPWNIILVRESMRKNLKILEFVIYPVELEIYY